MTRADFIARFPHASESTIRANCGPDASRGAPLSMRPAIAAGAALLPGVPRSQGGALPAEGQDGLASAPAKQPRGRKPSVKRVAARVARTRNAGTWTEARYWQAVRSALRRGFRFWKPIQDALRRARIPFKGSHGQRFAYICAACLKPYKRTHVSVDHIVPCGSLKSLADVAGFLERLTAEGEESYQVLCDKCHQEKTKRDNSK